MVAFITILSSALLAGIAIAQDPNASFNSTVINQVSSEIDAPTKSSWCTSQNRACDVLCNSAATMNNCSSITLDYQCTCKSNDSAPMFQYYVPTMITNICQKYLADCRATAASDPQAQAAQAACAREIVCGTVNVESYANSSAGQASSTTSSSTSSATSGTTSNTASPSPSKGAAATVDFNAAYTTGIFGTLLFSILGLAL